MRPRIGLLFRYGPQQDSNTKALRGLSDSRELKDIGVVNIDWRYRFDSKDEDQLFKHSDASYIDFCKTEHIKNEINYFMKQKNKDFKEVSKAEEVSPAMIAEYNKSTKTDLLADAEDIYKCTTGKTLDQSIDEYLQSVDGIYVPGFVADLDAKYSVDVPSKFAPDSRREIFERVLIKKAIERGIPVIGICAGSWMVASCFEGVKTSILGAEAIAAHYKVGTEKIDDTDVQMLRLPVHSIDINPGTMLHGVVKNAKKWRSKPGAEKSIEFNKDHKPSEDKDDILRMGVNSTHWRVVVAQENSDKIDINGLLVISAVEPGHKSIEAFESKFGVPVMGIQFHPENRIPMIITRSKITPDLEYPLNKRILHAFAESAKTYANKQTLLDQHKKISNTPFLRELKQKAKSDQTSPKESSSASTRVKKKGY